MASLFEHIAHFCIAVTCVYLSQLNSLGGKELLARFVVVEPSEMLLEPSEALRCSTEALKMFAVAASYGQACSLYK